MTVKESYNVAGMPITWGIPMFEVPRSNKDAVAVVHNHRVVSAIASRVVPTAETPGGAETTCSLIGASSAALFPCIFDVAFGVTGNRRVDDDALAPQLG